jgi:ATP-binding cassette subfamily B protein
MFNEALTAMAGAERVFSILDTRTRVDAIRPTPWCPRPPRRTRRAARRRLSPTRPDAPSSTASASPPRPDSVSPSSAPPAAARAPWPDSSPSSTSPSPAPSCIDGHRHPQPLQPLAPPPTSASCPSRITSSPAPFYDNIRVVKPGATRDDVREALAKLDCLEPSIASIPDGLDAEVGERGSGPVARPATARSASQAR